MQILPTLYSAQKKIFRVLNSIITELLHKLYRTKLLHLTSRIERQNRFFLSL